MIIYAWWDSGVNKWRFDYTAPNGNSINISEPTLEAFVAAAKVAFAFLEPTFGPVAVHLATGPVPPTMTGL